MSPRYKQRGPKPQVRDVKGTLFRLLSYLKEFKLRMILIVCFVLFSSGANVAGNYLLKPLINQHILPLMEKSPTLAALMPFIRMLLFMGLIYCVGAASTYLYQRLMVQVSNGTLNALRRDLFNHLQDLPISYFDSKTHGELMSRFTSDVDTIREALSQGITQLISSSVTLIGSFSFMLMLSPLLTLFIVAMVLIMFFAIKKIGGKSADFFVRQQKAVGEVNGFVEEMIEGQKVVKVFCHEDKVKEEFGILNENLRKNATNANTFASILMPVMGNLSYMTYALISAAGALQVIRGAMDIGSVASFLQFTRTFSNPITQISQQFNSILASLAGAERIFQVLDEKPEEDRGYVELVNVKKNGDGTLSECPEHTGSWAWKHPHETGELTYTPLTGDVRFENVTFGYSPKNTVLHDISLYAKPGQKIAFVGSTGAGKTTITNLINRFYEIQDGKIRYDGINIQKIKKSDLRRSLAMVLQDTHLFTGTVMENIRYGNLYASDEEVIAAAKLANADTFIRHLPQGYHTILTSDGTNLSQGQRQLLSIARAAVADPPVLILDEATSSIDTRTEALIEKGMDTLMKGRTVFVIAHRLSTVRNANAIMVLENGHIIERGNHEALLEQKGKYYQLYTGQFELS